MQIAGTLVILFGMAFWANHTHKVPAWQNHAPDRCAYFDMANSHENKAYCDAWFASHKDVGP